MNAFCRFGLLLAVLVVCPVLSAQAQTITLPPPALKAAEVPDAPKVDVPKVDAPKADTPKAADAPKADSDTITLLLLDGSVITGKLSMKEISVETEFGKLTVPVSSIRTFTPGLTSHPDLGKNLETLIKNLGSANFNERDAAQKAILKIGPPAKVELQRFVDDTDTERRTRVKAILEEFDQQTSDDEDGSQQLKGGLQKGDVVETSEFSIVGKIGPSSFDIATQYGQLSIKLSDIQRGQRIVQQKEEVRKAFNVEGNYIVHRSMKSTGIKVEKGDKISFTADGSITMSPWGNQAVSSPDGAQNYGWYIPNQIPAGALVGRVGDSGKIFKVGSKSRITADRAGILNLAIGMEPNYSNQSFPGEYHTKIRVEKK